MPTRREKKGGDGNSDVTFIGEVHRKCGAYVHARDEPPALEYRNPVQLVEDDFGREVPETGAVHDQKGVSFAALELPFSFDACVCEASDATTQVRTVGLRSNRHLVIGCE